jgi:hypothetical protein
MGYHYRMALPDGFPVEPVAEVMDRRGYRLGRQWERAELPGSQLPVFRSQCFEWRWELPEERGWVSFVFDHHVDVPKISAQSFVVGRPATTILVDLGADLPLMDHEPLRRAATAGPRDERAYALRALVAVVETCWDGAVDALCAALRDPDDAIRRAAVIAIARFPYRLFVEPLHEMAAVELQPDLKADASRLAHDLEAFSRSNAPVNASTEPGA